MAEKFHSEADKTVYVPRTLDVEEASEEVPTEEPAKKTTPAKSASTKKES